MVKKAIDVEAKDNLQPPFKTKKIVSKCPKGHKPSVKKVKDKSTREHRDKASKDKAKSHNFSFTNQLQIQAPKKDNRSRWRGHLATGVNITEVTKKNKDKAKDLSHVKYYTYKQKDHYAKKCHKKAKN